MLIDCPLGPWGPNVPQNVKDAVAAAEAKLKDGSLVVYTGPLKDTKGAEVLAAGKTIDREGTRQRLTIAMENAVTTESDALANRLNFLATVGSVAPFVGLFGTVWGIMDSFFNIGAQANSSLAVVAPGISEALFATAIGLFAAIPAVIAYNKLSSDAGALGGRLETFADEFSAILSRQIDQHTANRDRAA